MTSGLTMNHKIGDLIWSQSAHEIAIIVGYFPNGLHGSAKFKYSVCHSSTGNRFFYTEEMIEEGKRHLEAFYEREASNR